MHIAICSLPFGSPTKVTVAAGDIATRISQSFYDATGRFVIKTINPKGDEELFNYEPKYGNLTQKTDISLLVSNFYYDGVGRLIKTVLPDGTTNVVQYDWVQGPNSFSTYSKTVLNQGESYFKTFYNHLGQQTSTETVDMNGVIVTDTKYDYSTGLVTESSEPHYANANTTPYLITKYTYEPKYYRTIKTETFVKTGTNAPVTKNIFTNITFNVPSKYYSVNGITVYNPGFIKTSDQTGKILVKFNNAAGQITKVTNQVNIPSDDPLNPNAEGDLETSDYTFNSNGNPKDVKLSYSNISDIITTSFLYNQLGLQWKLIDPTVGTTTYEYNALGELKKQTEANANNYTYNYDILGRMTDKTGSASGTSTYQYVTGPAGKNQLQKITGPNGIVTTEYTYDNLNRPTSKKETVGTKIFTSSFEYDVYSRLSKYTYPSGYVVKHNYSANGELLNMTNDANALIWRKNNQNATGQITDYTYGNNINTLNQYSDLHLLSKIEHGAIHKQEFIFEPTTGNLKQRDFYNLLYNTHNREKFGFDEKYRLGQTKQVDPNNLDNPLQTNNTVIDIKGNITHKDDAGDFGYTNPALPYSITQITNPTPNISTNTLGMLINDLRKVSQLTEAVTNKEMNFTYGNDDERIKVKYKVNSVDQYTRYYQDNYDAEENAAGTNTKQWTYIYAPTGLAAVYYQPNNTTGQLLYALTDHLGSPVLLTNQSQQIQEEYSFDAWGRRRNPTNWAYTGFSQPTILNRGFTFHEHIDEFKLINMNGRIYDPILGRFKQPDNYVQEPDNLQNFNRYAYVLNNPLTYNDPTGEVWHIVIGAVVGGVINLGIKAYQGKITTLTDGFVAFGIGALAGGIGAATGGVAFAAAGGAAGGAGGFAAGALGAGTGAAFSSPIQGALNTAYFKDPDMTPYDHLKVIGFSAVTGGLLNGGIAAYNGRNFWNGNLSPNTNIPQGNLLNQNVVHDNSNNLNNYDDLNGNISSNVNSKNPVIHSRNPLTGKIESVELKGFYKGNARHADFTVTNKTPTQVMESIGMGTKPMISSDGKCLFYEMSNGIKINYYQNASSTMGPTIQFQSNINGAWIDFLKLRFN